MELLHRCGLPKHVAILVWLQFHSLQILTMLAEHLAFSWIVLHHKKYHQFLERKKTIIFRCCFICGMNVPAVLIPCAKPLEKWFGADDPTNEMGCHYVYTLLGCSFVSCNFLMCLWCSPSRWKNNIIKYFSDIIICYEHGHILSLIFTRIPSWNLRSCSCNRLFRIYPRWCKTKIEWTIQKVFTTCSKLFT